MNLPSFDDRTKQFRRISAETFCGLSEGHPDSNGLIVVDCRTKREYDGGHIRGAIRAHPFFDNFPVLYAKVYDKEKLFVFYCEFSAYRAPSAIRRFYDQHRFSGRDKCDLQAFVLDGGFSQFGPGHPSHCVGRYLPEAAGTARQSHPDALD
jgi:M-phase inducer tyrosine phosphatase